MKNIIFNILGTLTTAMIIIVLSILLSLLLALFIVIILDLFISSDAAYAFQSFVSQAIDFYIDYKQVFSWIAIAIAIPVFKLLKKFIIKNSLC